MDDEETSVSIDSTASFNDAEKLLEHLEKAVHTVKGRSSIINLLISPEFTLIEDVHRFLKNHLLTLEKSKCDVIGQLYLRAWKTADENRREELEETCIQDLISCALLTKRQVAEYCLAALDPFFKQKPVKTIKDTMYSLAEPLLWRSLKAPNVEIRYNAIKMLFKMFPMTDKDLSQQLNLELIQKQIKIIKECLFDDVEEIREITVGGICHAINEFWTYLAASDIRELLELLLDDLALDASSPSVRAKVYKGIMEIAQEPLSHATLAHMLPQRLASGLQDPSPSVRLALVQLMSEIHSNKTMKRVVPMNELIHHLGTESSRVVEEAIIDLTLSVFFHENDSSEEQFKRMLPFFKTDVPMVRKLYQSAIKVISVDTAASQIAQLLHAVYRCIRKAQRVDRSSNDSDHHSGDDGNDAELSLAMNGDGKENAAMDEAELTVQDVPVMIALLDCASIMWNSIGPELSKEEHSHVKGRLERIGGGMMVHCVRYFENSPVMESTLILLQFMKNVSHYMPKKLMRKVSALEDAGFDPKEHGVLAETVCYLNVNDLFDAVSKWWRNFKAIPTAAPEGTPPPSRPKRVRISVPEAQSIPKPRLGIQLISYLLERAGTRTYILRSHPNALRDLRSELQEIWDHCISLVAPGFFDAYWTHQLFKLHATIVCLLCDTEGGTEEASKYSASFLDHLRITIVPAYKASLNAADEMTENCHLMASAILKAAFEILNDFVICGMCNGKDNILIMISDFTKHFIKDNDATFHSESVQLAYHVVDHITNYGIDINAIRLMRPWIREIEEFAIAHPDLFLEMNQVNSLMERFVDVVENNLCLDIRNQSIEY